MQEEDNKIVELDPEESVLQLSGETVSWAGEEQIEATFDPKDINISMEQQSLYAIISRLDSGRIDLNPEFQRSGDLWNDYYQSRLIESILLRFPLPAFYFDASDDDEWLVVDGLQRLSALKNFVIDKKLKLTGLVVLHELNGYKFDSLPYRMKARINEFQVMAYLIKPGTPKEVKYDIFNRINTGGLSLTSQEIRHALNQRIAAPFLRNLVYKPNTETPQYSENYAKYINVNDKRMAGRELILRYLAFKRVGWEYYKPTLQRFLDLEMERIEQGVDNMTLHMIDQLWKALDLAQKLFGVHKFSKTLANPNGRRLLNSSLFEVWTVLLSELSETEQQKLLENKHKLVEGFKGCLLNVDFQKAITSSTTSKSNVNLRFTWVNEVIKQNI